MRLGLGCLAAEWDRVAAATASLCVHLPLYASQSNAKRRAHQIGSHLIRLRVCSEPSHSISTPPMNMVTTCQYAAMLAD